MTDAGHVRVYRASDLAAVADFQPYAGFPVGVTVAVAEINGDTDIVTGSGLGARRK